MFSGSDPAGDWPALFNRAVAEAVAGGFDSGWIPVGLPGDGATWMTQAGVSSPTPKFQNSRFHQDPSFPVRFRVYGAPSGLRVEWMGQMKKTTGSASSAIFAGTIPPGQLMVTGLSYLVPNARNVGAAGRATGGWGVVPGAVLIGNDGGGFHIKYGAGEPEFYSLDGIDYALVD